MSTAPPATIWTNDVSWLTEALKRYTSRDDVEHDMMFFIRNVEADLNRRLRVVQNSVRLEVFNGRISGADEELIRLPTDFLNARLVSVNGEDAGYLTPEQMLEHVRGATCGGGTSDNKYYYTIEGGNDQWVSGGAAPLLRMSKLPPKEEISSSTLNAPILYTGYQRGTITLSWDYPTSNFSDIDLVQLVETVVTTDTKHGTSSSTTTTYDETATDPGFKQITVPGAVTRYIYDYTYHLAVHDDEGTTALSNTKLVAVALNQSGVVSDGDVAVPGSFVTFDFIPVDILYYAAISTITNPDDASSNWVAKSAMDVYVYGCMFEASKFYYDDGRANDWKQKYDEAVEEIIRADRTDRWSGGSLKTRAV